MMKSHVLLNHRPCCFVGIGFIMTSLMLIMMTSLACSEPETSYSYSPSPQRPVAVESIRKIKSTGEFQEQVLSTSMPVVVEFYQPRCAQCMELAPIIYRLADDYRGQASFVKVDVKQLTSMVGEYLLKGTPTLLFMKNGREVNRIVGLKDEMQIRTTIESLIK